MWRADSLGKTLILGKIEGRRRRGWQRMRLLDSITDSMDRSSEGQGSLAFTRDRDRPAFERLSVSCGGTCQQWNLFQKDLYQYAITSQDFFSQYPWPRLGHCGLRPPPETTNTHRQVCLSLLWGHCSFLLDPGVLKALFVPSKTLFPQSCGRSIIKSYWPSKSNFPVGSLSLFQILRLWNLLVGPRTFVTQQELLWNNCPPVCGSPARRLYSGLMSTSSKRKELPFNDAGRTTALNNLLNFPAQEELRDYWMSFLSFYGNKRPRDVTCFPQGHITSSDNWTGKCLLPPFCFKLRLPCPDKPMTELRWSAVVLIELV